MANNHKRKYRTKTNAAAVTAVTEQFVQSLSGPGFQLNTFTEVDTPEEYYEPDETAPDSSSENLFIKAPQSVVAKKIVPEPMAKSPSKKHAVKTAPATSQNLTTKAQPNEVPSSNVTDMWFLHPSYYYHRSKAVYSYTASFPVVAVAAQYGESSVNYVLKKLHSEPKVNELLKKMNVTMASNLTEVDQSLAPALATIDTQLDNKVADVLKTLNDSQDYILAKKDAVVGKVNERVANTSSVMSCTLDKVNDIVSKTRETVATTTVSDLRDTFTDKVYTKYTVLRVYFGQETATANLGKVTEIVSKSREAVLCTMNNAKQATLDRVESAKLVTLENVHMAAQKTLNALESAKQVCFKIAHDPKQVTLEKVHIAIDTVDAYKNVTLESLWKVQTSTYNKLASSKNFVLSYIPVLNKVMA